MAYYTITSDAEFSGVTVIFPDGGTHTIGSDDDNFEKVVAGLFPTQTLSDDELLELVAPFEAVYKKLTKLSERVSRKGTKLFFDGDLAAHRLATHIISVMDSGAPEEEWAAWLKFWEKAATNPSVKGQDEFFIFVEKHGLQITPDGDAVLYKAVRADGTSMHAGPGIVDGVEYEYDHLPNHVGAVVEIPRSKVDPQRRTACSTGLHVGDHSYAAYYLGSNAPRLLNVLVNPRDVVSVPLDENDRKIRVCRYIVLSENPDKKKWDKTVISFSELGLPEPEVEEAEEETPQTIKVNVTKRKIETPAPAATGGSRKDEYKALITALMKADPTTNLKRYKNKRITAGRRDEFEAAANELGYKL